MAAIVDEYLDSPMDDDVFPCKGCGEILEEGKAFELAGNRWHLDCFRCNTCGTLLDSDANLLLLGDGSLICNNCTYSCSACGNKIEDLAILTGDQAFCATCFRCRNCKRKIENLRYARTSQGIFCMGCHETLMARRRKKTKAAAAAKAREKESPNVTEKSLPALPPNVIPNNAFSNDRVDPDSDTPTELSPRPRNAQRPSEASSRGSSKPARSPERQTDSSRLDASSSAGSSYRKNRNSTIIGSHDSIGNESADSFFIPVALDPSPGPPPVRSGSDSNADPKRDYFSVPKSTQQSTQRSGSTSSTPHIAFQERGRQYSSDFDGKMTTSKSLKSSHSEGSRTSKLATDRAQMPPPAAKPPTGMEDFKLQDAPKSRKLATSSNTSSPSSAIAPDSLAGKAINGAARKEKDNSAESKKPSEGTPPRVSEDSKGREDELEASPHAPPHPAKSIARKEVPAAGGKPANAKPPSSERQEDVLTISRQSSSRPSISESKNASDKYMEPRSAPPPPKSHTMPSSVETLPLREDQLSIKASPSLPRWSSGGDLNMDEDMARILGTDEGSSSILRRVSNAVRHGRTNSVESGQHVGRLSHTRSASETTRATASPRWSKTPGLDPNGHGLEVSSPVSLTSADDPALLKTQLRNSEQRVAELEKHFNTESDLKNLNKKLVEKRKTVSVLDTQTEIMIRQLEVLAGYVERAKETKKPVDPRELEDSAIKEFVQKLDSVKQAMSTAIEQLHEERDLLIEEKNQAMASRDRALMEFEQLSSKNAQLADMNNDLAHQLQARYKSQIGADVKSPNPNGLGIYQGNKTATASAVQLDSASMTTGTTLHGDDDSIVEAGPTVVQVRKGQVKKFNWKKGSKTVAQNITKGVGRAVVAFQNDRATPPMAGDSIGMPYNTTVTAIDSPAAAGMNGQNRPVNDPSRQGFGFFGKKTPIPKSMSAMSAQVPAEPPSVLFGSELTERTEFERRQIPSVVTRCIEEVELRGMDQEGIYRKTGGNSQVTMIKEGFDKNENYDISDPDLDITAVTSVLKQYFRKLPTPLLTYEVYERVLESTAIADETERCEFLHKTFTMMPERHRDCLEFLMFHLHRVSQREGENLMTPKNLAVVFAPTIMRDLNIEREMTDMHAKNLAIQFVIENTQTIFDDA